MTFPAGVRSPLSYALEESPSVVGEWDCVDIELVDVSDKQELGYTHRRLNTNRRRRPTRSAPHQHGRHSRMTSSITEIRGQQPLRLFSRRPRAGVRVHRSRGWWGAHEHGRCHGRGARRWTRVRRWGRRRFDGRNHNCASGGVPGEAIRRIESVWWSL